MNEAFYFWKDGVRITALYRNPILELELFGIVSCVRVKFSEKWRFKCLHVA